MKKVNYEEKTATFNKVRMENLNKTFFYDELFSLLKENGISNNITELANKHGFFDKEVVGDRTLYSFQKTPLHKNQMEKLYAERRKSVKAWKAGDSKKKAEEITEEKAITFLKGLGYQIRKIVGFNHEKLSQENPELYKKYLKYETV